MIFARPGVLLLLIIPFLLMVWWLRRRGDEVVFPFDHHRPRRRPILRVILEGLGLVPAMILLVAILLLAGPKQLGPPKSQRVLTNIEFCIDVSGSMTTKFGDGIRYDASMEAINKFLDARKGDAFGLTFFGSGVLHWVPLTQDISAFRCAPPFMNPHSVPPWMGGTRIGNAVSACRKILAEREEGDRMIVLISDGESYDLANGAAEELASKLKQENIVLYAVHVAEGDAPDDMVNLARGSGGEVYACDDPQGLAVVFSKIGELQKAKLIAGSAEALDWFFPFCIAGLTLVGFATFSQLGLRYTPW